MATSPRFRINGGGVGVKASVSAAGAISATLDSIDGVNDVVWSIASTDETSSAGSYVLVRSGAKNQTVTTTALAAGTAAILKAVVNGGVDPQTGDPSAAMTATAKFFVPTGGGLEVGCADEGFESDPVFGSTALLNAAIRLADAAAGGVATATPSKLALRDGNADCAFRDLTVRLLGGTVATRHTRQEYAAGPTQPTPATLTTMFTAALVANRGNEIDYAVRMRDTGSGDIARWKGRIISQTNGAAVVNDQADDTDTAFAYGTLATATVTLATSGLNRIIKVTTPAARTVDVWVDAELDTWGA